MANEPSAPFAFLMDASMLGVGVGFDTRVRPWLVHCAPGLSSADQCLGHTLDRSIDRQGAGRVTVFGPNRRQRTAHVIPDSREGWVESVRYLIDAYFLNMPLPEFDYSKIRPAGMCVRGWLWHRLPDGYTYIPTT